MPYLECGLCHRVYYTADTSGANNGCDNCQQDCQIIELDELATIKNITELQEDYREIKDALFILIGFVKAESRENPPEPGESDQQVHTDLLMRFLELLNSYQSFDGIMPAATMSRSFLYGVMAELEDLLRLNRSRRPKRSLSEKLLERVVKFYEKIKLLV